MAEQFNTTVLERPFIEALDRGLTVRAALAAALEQVADETEAQAVVAQRLKGDATPQSLYEAYRRFHNESQGKVRCWNEGHQAIVTFLRAGLSLRETQRYLDVPDAFVVHHLSFGFDGDPSAFFAADELLRGGATSYGAVARATGLDDDRVRWLAERIGCLSLAQQRRAQGGGLKVGPGVRERVLELHAEGGRTYAEIVSQVQAEMPEAAAALTRSNAIVMVRRHGHRVAA